MSACREFLGTERGYCRTEATPGARYCAAHLEDRRAYDRRTTRSGVTP